MTGPLTARLKKIRKQRKWTQLMMSKTLGINRNTYSQYELGLRQPPIERLIDIAARLGVSLDYLTGVSKFELTVDAAISLGILKRQRRVRQEDFKPYVLKTNNLPAVADRDPDAGDGDYPLT